jgi:hypothetical protein
LALRRQRHSLARIAAVTGVLALAQWILFAYRIPACYTIPLFLVAWIVPAAVVVQTVRDIDSGLWAESRYSRLRTIDLWWSRLIAPLGPWLVALAILSLPVFFAPYLPGGRRPAPDLRIGRVPLYYSDGAVWAFAMGVQACAFAYGALALSIALRVRKVRSALIGTYMASAATAYIALAFHVMSPVLGPWANMEAMTWVVFVEPWALLAPPWMVGGTLYNIRTEFVRSHIVEVTAFAFSAGALVMLIVSYLVVARQRRADRIERGGGE